MDIHEKSRIHWACRRGMLELDVAIMPFFKYEYDTLNDTDKKAFVALLKADDPDLFNWMMDHGEPADPELKRIIRVIQQRNRERGPVAL
ncbi:FAD assembly factor SdhE [Pantoea sp. KPR_PJ]|uniref:FAD assembly factor SdhE n=1 Tax=Pantoea sp. KPR_PJ TaxID=2738375 RepID=UPI0035277BCE